MCLRLILPGQITCVSFVYLACGEPPMCMSCCSLFAVKKAIDAARVEVGNKDLFSLRKKFDKSLDRAVISLS